MKRLWLLPVLLLAASCRPKEPADLVLHNGKIVTADEAFSIHEAVVVKDGKIVAVGGNDLLDSYEAARVVDLKGEDGHAGIQRHPHSCARPGAPCRRPHRIEIADGDLQRGHFEGSRARQRRVDHGLRLVGGPARGEAPAAALGPRRGSTGQSRDPHQRRKPQLGREQHGPRARGSHEGDARTPKAGSSRRTRKES